MKVLIILTSLLAITFASIHEGYYSNPEAHTYPKLAHDGQPIETPAVQALKHAHFVAQSEALARVGGGYYANAWNGGEWQNEGGAQSYSNQQLGGHATYANAGPGHGAYHGPIHIPKIGHNGVPIDTPEVQHARAAHYNALVKASALAGSHGYEHHQERRSIHEGHYSNPEAHTYPHLDHDGQPIETPAVQALKHAHFAAHSEALARVGGGYHGDAWNGDEWNYEGGAQSYSNQQLGGHANYAYGGHGHGAYHGPIHIPKIGHNGVPIDTPEVQHARAAHYAALAKASALSASYGHEHHHERRSIHEGHYSNPEAHTYPHLDHDGQPIETPAVQALKHAHFAAHSEALARVGGGYHGDAWNGDEWKYEGGAQSYSNQQLGGHANYAYAGDGHGAYHGPIHIPKIGHNGVPIDTPEVQHARHQHLAALAEASAKSYHNPHGEHHY